MEGEEKHLSKGALPGLLDHVLTLFSKMCEGMLLKNILDLFGLDGKLLIHTVRTHVINYDCVFFIQNSCWGNRVSSDCLRGGGARARGSPASCRPRGPGPWLWE